MKKLICLLLVVCTLCTVFIGCKSPSDENGGESSTQPGTTDAKNDLDVITWMNHSFDKVIANDKIPSENKRSNELTIYMGRGELEGCTVSVRSDKTVSGMSLNVVEAPSDITIMLFKENTVVVEGKRYPDALSPLNSSFLVRGNITQSFFVRAETTASTAAGDKVVKLHLRDAEGNVVSQYVINIHVWDITYSDKLTYQTLTDIEEDQLIRFYNIPEGDEGEKQLEEMYVKYYEFLLDYRMCAYDLPYDILDERANKYMSDDRVTAFIVPIDVDNKTLKAYYKKLCTNPVWLSKAVIYLIDEPISVEMYDKLIARAKEVKAICPNLKTVSPFFINVAYRNGLDAVDVQIQYNDVLCAKTMLWGDSGFASRLSEAKNNGKTVWSYICWEPGHPYTNLYVNEKGLNHRIQFWQQYSNDSDGFLYWSANYWGVVDNPWTDAATVKGLSKDVYGDGLLLYNGNFAGVDGPCASLRLEILRDGLEDIELLKYAEEKLGRDWVMNKVKSVTKSVVSYTINPSTFINIRIEIGNALEVALG